MTGEAEAVAAAAIALARARRRSCPVCRGMLRILAHRHPDGQDRAELEACAVPGPCPGCDLRPAVQHVSQRPGPRPGTGDVALWLDRGGHSRERIGEALVQELAELAGQGLSLPPDC